MIRIGAAPAPAFLSSPFMQDRTRELLAHLRLSPLQRRQRRPPVADGLFYQGDLHDAVADRCRHKCVFCETDEVQPHIEHFRPIQVRDAFERGEDDHYAWLAYEWDNLIYVCDYCQRSRRDQFPVKFRRAAYLASFKEVRRVEKPWLIDPYRDTPERHFDFLLDGRCIPLTERGRVTATMLELDDERLRHLRRFNLELLTIQLSAWADHNDRSVLHDAFANKLPFLGARLNVLKRALGGLPFGEAVTRGALRHLPDRLAGYLAGADADRRLLKARLEMLGETDRAVIDSPSRFPDFALYPPLVSRSRSRFAVSKPRYVDRIAARDLKGIAELEIKPSKNRRKRRGAPCLMFLGENATGKSTLLQGIALALLGPSEAKRVRIDSDDFLRSEDTGRWDQLTPPSAKADVEFRFGEGRASFHLNGQTRQIVGSGPPATLVLGYGPRRYFDPDRYEAELQPFAGVRTLFHPLATIPYPGGWLNSLTNDEFDAVARALRPILALAETDDLVRHEGRLSVIVEDRPVPVERLSDGYRSMFALAADIFRQMLEHFDDLESAHGVVLIDEIETHLHPRWKMQVMNALRRALPRVQFIVTTHDPLCLRGMDDGEVVVLQRDETGAISLVRDLPDLKGMRAEQLLTSDYFGLSSTIDPGTELGVARFAKAVAESPDQAVISEAMSRLTLGDSAGEQVIQAALNRFLSAREKPAGTLRSDVRASAVEAVYRALAEPLPLETRIDRDPA